MTDKMEQKQITSLRLNVRAIIDFYCVHRLSETDSNVVKYIISKTVLSRWSAEKATEPGCKLRKGLESLE